MSGIFGKRLSRREFSQIGGASFVGEVTNEAFAVGETVQSKVHGTVSVFDFMTTAQTEDVQAGTLTLDVTLAINAAIASLGRLTTLNPNSATNPVTTIGGGRIRFPKGKYLVTKPILYSGGQIWEGEEWGTYIVCTPTSPFVNCVDVDLTKPTWGNTNERFTIKSMYFLAGNTNAYRGLYLRNTNAVALEHVRVSGFSGENVRIGQSAASSSYYNSIYECQLVDAPVNIYFESTASATNIYGGILAHTTAYALADYSAIVEASSVNFWGTSFEGKAKIAQVWDKGRGTRFTGIYYEDAGYNGVAGIPIIRKDFSRGLQGNTTLDQNAIGRILLDNYPQTVSDAVATTPYVPMTFIKGHPRPVDLIENGNFRYGLKGWGRAHPGGFNGAGEIHLITESFMGSRASLLMMHDGTNSPLRVHTTIPSRLFKQYVGAGQRVYFHLITEVNPGEGSMAALRLNTSGAGTSNKWSEYNPVQYGSGKSMYTISVPVLADATMYLNIDFIANSATASAKIYGAFTCLGGEDYLACPSEYLFSDTAVPCETTYGTFEVGDVVRNGAYALGAPIEWICKAAGTNGNLITRSGVCVTCNTVSGNTSITHISDSLHLGPGMYVSILGVKGAKKIVSVDIAARSAVLDSACNASVIRADMSYANAVFSNGFVPV